MKDIDPVIGAIHQLLDHKVPVVVAIDGRSGTGKSTLAARIGSLVGGVVIDQDDFYSGGDVDAWEPFSPEERVDRCIDWRRVRREVLEPLIAGDSASWHPFDWATLRGLSAERIDAGPANVIVLDGAYSTRDELADLLDLTVLVTLPEDIRRHRLVQREGEEWMASWHRVWDEAEDYYFHELRSPGRFDIVIPRTR